MIDIIVDIDWKDIEQWDQSQHDKNTTWQYRMNPSDFDIRQKIIKHDQDSKKNQGIDQGAC